MATHGKQALPEDIQTQNLSGAKQDSKQDTSLDSTEQALSPRALSETALDSHTSSVSSANQAVEDTLVTEATDVNEQLVQAVADSDLENAKSKAQDEGQPRVKSEDKLEDKSKDAVTSAYLASLNQPPIKQNCQDRRARVEAHLESMRSGDSGLGFGGSCVNEDTQSSLHTAQGTLEDITNECLFNKPHPSLFKANDLPQGVVEEPVQFAVPEENSEHLLFEPLFAKSNTTTNTSDHTAGSCLESGALENAHSGIGTSQSASAPVSPATHLSQSNKELNLSKSDAAAIYAAAAADESSALSIFKSLNPQEGFKTKVDYLQEREAQAARKSEVAKLKLAQFQGTQDLAVSQVGSGMVDSNDKHISSASAFLGTNPNEQAPLSTALDSAGGTTANGATANATNASALASADSSQEASLNEIDSRVLDIVQSGVSPSLFDGSISLAQKDAANSTIYFNNGNRIIRKAVIVSKVYHRPVGGAIVEVARLLNNLGVEAYTDQSTAIGFNLVDVPVISRRGMKETDLIIVVGGDGSVLGASRSLVDLQVPVLGINRGHLGLLTDISPSNIEDALTKVVSGNYTTEKRMMIDVRVLRRDEEGSEELIGQSLALNETVIHSGILAHMIVCRVSINGRYMYTMRSDGIIVGTPTGSTAYSLSAGGPIIEPHLDVLCLVPMFPQSLNCSPIILPGKSNVEIEFEIKDSMPEWVNVNCDGQITIRADTKCLVSIRQHSNQLQLIHPAGYDYYSVLRQKLGWGQSLVN